MAKKNSFNIPALYQQVFGIKGVRFAIPAANTIAHAVEDIASFAAGQFVNQALNANLNQSKLYKDVQTIPLPTAASVQSVLGTPIYEQITLTVPATVSNGVVSSPQSLYTFPDWPLFDINPAWNIQKEPVQNGNGTVKEFISQDDFSITIRGFLINYASQDYPDQLVSDLWNVINAKKSLGITSQVFNLFGIHNIVIQDARFPAVEGFMNMQPFELNCISDEPVILLIKSVKTQRAITPGL